MVIGPDGKLWAATGGGVLRWTDGPEIAPRLWTTADGLSSNDARTLRCDGTGVAVTTATGTDRIAVAGTVQSDSDARSSERLVSDGTADWEITDAGLTRLGDNCKLSWPEGLNAATVGNVTGLASDGRDLYLATSLGLWKTSRDRWKSLPLPAGSPGSHVSALCGTAEGGIIAGLYGDGLYKFDGQWARLPGQLAECRFPTAILRMGTSPKENSAARPAAPLPLEVGTAAGGVCDYRNGCWTKRALPPTLPSADVVCLAVFQGSVWAGSFDRGLVQLSGDTVGCVTERNGLSSDSPRSLVPFHGVLYARSADGQVDCTADGAHWQKAFSKPELPRQEVYALAADDERLLIGGWAGWAATDGTKWERHYHDPELAGQVVTAIASRGGEVWIGTQKRGLLCYANGAYTVYQEPQGLTDDWITCIASAGDRLLAGTYTGGLLEKEGPRFVPRFNPSGFAIRAIAFEGDTGPALAATPLGLYRETASNRWELVDPQKTGGLETQAVLATAGGCWAATRTGLAFVPQTAMKGTG